MAVPKRKTGRMKTHSRRSSNDVCKPKARAVCSQCGAPVLPHHVCGNCGNYNGREIIVVD